MRNKIVLSILLVSGVGCQQEPTTLRGQAEQAQEELADSRETAAEMVANSEENAVDEIADARQDATQNIHETKRKAHEIVVDAEANLNQKLERLEEAGIPRAAKSGSQ